jgi:hypothetical protein
VDAIVGQVWAVRYELAGWGRTAHLCVIVIVIVLLHYLTAL